MNVCPLSPTHRSVTAPAWIFCARWALGTMTSATLPSAESFQNSLETTSLLKELGAKYVVSRAERDVQAKFLLRNGADAVTYPEKQLAKWAAIRYTANHIFDYIELDEKHAIIEVAVPDSWQGHSIGELDIRKKYGVNILGVKRDGKTDVTISPETVLDGNLTLLVLGEYTALKKCFRL